MNREAIGNTAVCRYDKKEKAYIVKSPLLDIVMGASEKEDEAWEIFEDLLDACYIKYLEGKRVGQYQRRGRPAKGGVDLHAQVKVATKKELGLLAKRLGCSQGEAIDYLVHFHVAKAEPVVREQVAAYKTVRTAGSKAMTVKRSTKSSSKSGKR